MVDFKGTKLKVGDKVAVICGYTGGSRYLREKFVLGFTPQRVVVDTNPTGKYGSKIQSDKLVKL